MSALSNILKKEIRELLTPAIIVPVIFVAVIFGSMGGAIGGIEEDVKHGVYIGRLKNHGHTVDTNADKDVNKSIPKCTIWFETLLAARMFQDQVNIACLRINGYEVSNAIS